MREMAQKIDMDVLNEIIKLAEKAMVGGMGKKKPDMAVMELSVEGKPMGKGPGMGLGKMMGEKMMEEGEEEEPESKFEISEGDTSVEVESDDGNELSDADIEELLAAYKSKKG